jgi:hypothetical protein
LPAKAARFALGLPNAPFAIGKVIRDLARHDPDAALAAAIVNNLLLTPFFNWQRSGETRLLI